MITLKPRKTGYRACLAEFEGTNRALGLALMAWRCGDGDRSVQRFMTERGKTPGFERLFEQSAAFLGSLALTHDVLAQAIAFARYDEDRAELSHLASELERLLFVPLNADGLTVSLMGLQQDAHGGWSCDYLNLEYLLRFQPEVMFAALEIFQAQHLEPALDALYAARGWVAVREPAPRTKRFA